MSVEVVCFLFVQMDDFHVFVERKLLLALAEAVHKLFEDFPNGYLVDLEFRKFAFGLGTQGFQFLRSVDKAKAGLDRLVEVLVPLQKAYQNSLLEGREFLQVFFIDAFFRKELAEYELQIHKVEVLALFPFAYVSSERGFDLVDEGLRVAKFGFRVVLLDVVLN